MGSISSASAPGRLAAQLGRLAEQPAPLAGLEGGALVAVVAAPEVAPRGPVATAAVSVAVPSAVLAVAVEVSPLGVVFAPVAVGFAAVVSGLAPAALESMIVAATAIDAAAEEGARYVFSAAPVAFAVAATGGFGDFFPSAARSRAKACAVRSLECTALASASTNLPRTTLARVNQTRASSYSLEENNSKPRPRSSAKESESQRRSSTPIDTNLNSICYSSTSIAPASQPFPNRSSMACAPSGLSRLETLADRPPRYGSYQDLKIPSSLLPIGAAPPPYSRSVSKLAAFCSCFR